MDLQKDLSNDDSAPKDVSSTEQETYHMSVESQDDGSIQSDDPPESMDFLSQWATIAFQDQRNSVAHSAAVSSRRARRSFLVGGTVEQSPLSSIRPSRLRRREYDYDSDDEESSDGGDGFDAVDLFASNSKDQTDLLDSSFNSLASRRRREKLKRKQQMNVQGGKKCQFHRLQNFTAQIPAIIVACLLVLMASVPFGVAYFPIGWREDLPGGEVTTAGAAVGSGDEDEVHGSWPLPAKAAFGIRMCIFSTLAGQLGMTFTSKFTNPVVFQLVENVPFYHALADIVIAEQGYGLEALTTIMFLLGLGSIMVGVSLYILGKLELGRVVYFFPTHVLVGCIGGIGVFVIQTAVEVTNDKALTYDLEGLKTFIERLHLFGVAAVLEGILRLLSSWLTKPNGDPMFPLLSPVYFLSIIPLFYVGLWICGVDVETAKDMGYFLPDSVPPCVSDDCIEPTFYERVFDGHTWDIFTVIFFHLDNISWTAVGKAMPTLIGMTAFSILQLPVMIPAFAVSSNVEVDMNTELVAHAWSNGLAGLFGGIQNIMTYSFSLLYHKSGGYGWQSSLTIVGILSFFFVVGPAMTAFIPRAMAGAVLLHIGFDLFLEGIYDSYGVYDKLEYSGIWLITLVMTFFGMTAGLVAGVLSAITTYAAQSILRLNNPIFKMMSASTLRSSIWNRPVEADAILDHPNSGRSRILVAQLQGHIFFGNIVNLTDAIKSTLERRKGTEDEPLIVILDFTLVSAMDSSAGLAIAKLKDTMHRSFQVQATLFVTGSHRQTFPCEFALADALNSEKEDGSSASTTPAESPEMSEETKLLCRKQNEYYNPGSMFPKNKIYESLDEALILAEEILIARLRPDLARSDRHPLFKRMPVDEEEVSPLREHQLAAEYLEKLAPSNEATDIKENVALILSKCEREVYTKDQQIWRQGDASYNAKLLVSGSLMAHLEGTDISEWVPTGNFFGELGLIDGSKRLSTVVVKSERAVVFSLDREAWEDLVKNHPNAARMLDLIAIRYLAHRVQHVSNRIFETRCLPI